MCDIVMPQSKKFFSIDFLNKEVNTAFGISIIEQKMPKVPYTFKERFGYNPYIWEILNRWFVDESPYPKSQDKNKLSTDTKLGIAQIDDWFFKIRQIIGPKLVKKFDEQKENFDFYSELIRLQSQEEPTSNHIKITLDYVMTKSLMKNGFSALEKRNYEMAFESYYKAYFSGGETSARTNLAFFYLEGCGGVAKDRRYALRLLKESADEGDQRAKKLYLKYLN